jgi:hypothetical protein
MYQRFSSFVLLCDVLRWIFLFYCVTYSCGKKKEKLHASSEYEIFSSLSDVITLSTKCTERHDHVNVIRFVKGINCVFYVSLGVMV